MSKSVYWQEDIETEMGDAEIEWRFEFAPGEYLGLYCEDVEMDEKDYPDEWNIGVELSEAQA